MLFSEILLVDQVIMSERHFLHAHLPFSSPRICYTDSIGVQEDQYPPNIAVKVNQSYCHVPVSVVNFTRLKEQGG